MNADSNDGLDPRTAGALLGIVALLGIGFFVLAASLDSKSADPLYDPLNPESHTSSQLQVTPDLWKRRGEPAPDATPTAQPAPIPVPTAPQIPIKIQRQPPPTADQPKPPPTTEPG